MKKTLTFLCLIIVFLYTVHNKPIQIKKNQRFVDDKGRERIFHGLNMVAKNKPYIVRRDQFVPGNSFVQQDMELWEELGLNSLRLGTMWPGVEPEKQSYNMTYVEELKNIVNDAAKFGIYTMLDFHQDLLAERYGGDGIPDWAVHDEGAFKFPFPVNLFKKNPQWTDIYFTHAVNVAFQNLYDNYNGTLDSFGQFWQLIAQTFKDNDYILGFELMNEPWPGSIYKNPLNLIPGYGDKKNLQKVYDYISSEYIRKVDKDHIIFFESITWDDFFKTGFYQPPGGVQYENVSALAYHYYKPPNFGIDNHLYTRNQDRIRLKTGSFLSEFYLTDHGDYGQDQGNQFKELTDACDKYLESWMGWLYNAAGEGWLYQYDGQVNQTVAKKLARTYAYAVAGTIQQMNFDSQSGNFTLSYIADSQETTEIYLNENFYYPKGFDISIDTEKLAYFSPKKNKLHFQIKENTKFEPFLINIKITPKQ